MSGACRAGRLNVAKWLFEVCNAEILAKTANGTTPLLGAFYSPHLDVAQWLILNGAVNGSNGHVDPGILKRDAPQHRKTALLCALVGLLESHIIYTGVVLPSVLESPRFPRDAFSERKTTDLYVRAAMTTKIAPVRYSIESNLEEIPKFHTASFRTWFTCLQGHESAILPIIAGFAGIPRGRSLRDIREVSDCLKEWCRECTLE